MIELKRNPSWRRSVEAVKATVAAAVVSGSPTTTTVSTTDATDMAAVVAAQPINGIIAAENNGKSKPAKEALKENIKPHSMDISPWLVSSDVVTGSTKAKEATIIRKSVITTQL